MTDSTRALVEHLLVRLRQLQADSAHEAADLIEQLVKEQREDYTLIEQHVEKLESLTRELAEALEDTARLDWLSDQHASAWPEKGCLHHVIVPVPDCSLRDAIDAARAAGKEEG